MPSPVTVVIELCAKPGRRADLVAFVERMEHEHGPNATGYLGSSRYDVVGDPDRLVELADWESVEARAAHMEKSAATGAYAPLAELIVEPARITILQRLG